jgi:hypothetical protein
MPGKKRVRLQQFGIIHLPTLDLIYIRIPERNKIIFMVFHLFKSYIRNPYLFFISFFTLPPTEKRRWQPWSSRAYIRVGRWVLPSFYFCQAGFPNCWRLFLFCQNLMDAKLVCQTVGVAPSRVHRCSHLSSHNSRTRDATGLRANAARRSSHVEIGNKERENG